MSHDQQFGTAHDGTKIAYRIEPGADPVLLVHGFASTAELNWATSGWVRALADVGRGAVLVDLRGHGASDAPTDADSYSAEILAADLIAILDDAGLGQVDIVGYSLGAQITRVLAATSPARVGRIALGGIGPNEQFSTWGVDDLLRALRGEDVTVTPLAAELISAVQQGSSIAPEAAAACISGMAANPITAVPHVPAIIVAGADDPVARDAPELAAQLGAEFVAIPKRNHRNAVTARAFKQAVLGFLAN